MKKLATSTLSMVLLTTVALAQNSTQGGGKDTGGGPASDFPIMPLIVGLVIGLVIGYFLGARSKKA